MANQNFIDNSYKHKINSITNMRLISFVIWKFIFGLLFYYSFCFITSFSYISYYFLNNSKLNFFFSDYLMLYAVFTVADLLKMLVFKNYEDKLGRVYNLLLKLFLEPDFSNVFLILYGLIIFCSYTILQNSISYVRGFNKNKVFLNISLYR
jgi:hypothetical protein